MPVAGYRRHPPHRNSHRPNPPRALPGVVDAELVEPADDRPADVLHSPTDDVKPAEGRRVPDD